jgi:hypothetical protein
MVRKGSAEAVAKPSRRTARKTQMGTVALG